jgi:hypothetical protein
VQLAEQPFEHAGLADDDVHHVDPSLLGRVFLPRHVDELVDVVRRVGQEDILVGRDEPEDARDDSEDEEE